MSQAKVPIQSDGVKYVEIPKGWKRILENGSIHYISPSSSYLKSYENIIDYLKKDGTCKCGLDCPFHVHRVFNFDASVQNKEQKDELINSESHSSTCKLRDSNWQNGKSFVDSGLLQKPLNQTFKATAKKPPQFSFDGSHNKKAVNRSRAKLSDGPKAKKPRKVSSPLSDIPSPPPIPISSPVQNVPNNLGALNQGPLPSFASIVSSSKFFNPGPNRGPLHPTGSLPLQGNNKFAFPRILTPDISSVSATSSKVSSNTGVVNVMTSSAAFTSMTTAYTAAPSTIMTNSATAVTKTATAKTASAAVKNSAVTNTVAPNTISTPVSIIQNTTSQSDKTSIVMNTFSSNAGSLSMATSQSNSNIPCSVLPNVVSNAVCLVKTISTPTITNNKTVIMPIINTPTLPSVFAPLDGVSTDPVKTKPPPKPKRSRPSRAKPKPKPEMKLDDKSKMVKMAGSTPAIMTPGISTHPVSSHWPMTISHVPYQIPNTAVVSSSNSTSSVASSHTADNLSRPSVPQQIAMPSSIYMTTSNCQKQGQAMHISSPPVPNLQAAQPPLNHSSSIGNGKDSATSAPGVTPTNTYSVVATPRIQAPPGMVYVATAPGVGMFSPTYPYTAATPQLQISQASVSQQNKTASTTTPVVSTNQQAVTQGMTSESAQGKISFQVPGMYIQGTAANQMFPVNSQGFGVNQYKVPYQLQNAALYPNTGNAMTFITPNGAKATYPGLQTVTTGNIGQFAYPNPYMFNIVMPTTTNQQSTSSSTPSTPATPTSVTTSLHMIQPQSIQNPAVAAAFESFVPIAPAAAGATPRFAQTLAHLASAYNTFPQAGLVQGANHLQLAYQMMQMNPHGNAQQIANLGGLGTTDAVSKHPTAKQGSSDSVKGSGNTKSKPSSLSSSSNSPSTPVTQDHGGTLASSHTSTPSLTTSSHRTSTTTSVFQHQQVAASMTSDSQHMQENVTDSRTCPSENKNTKMIIPDQQCMDNDSKTDSEWRNEFNSSHKGNSLHAVKSATNGPMTTDQSESTNPSHNISTSSKQKKTTEVDTSKQDLSSETESQKYQQQPVNKSPVRTANVYEQNTKFPVENPGQANSHYSKQEFQTHSSSLEPKTSTIDNREPMKSPNFVDNVNYYETNPLLGMKRSCEAIEVYPDPPENLDEEEKEDYYSSNGESPEGNDAASECTLDLRHGDSSSMEDSFKAGAIQNVAKGLHNGGCNATHSEQDTFHGSNVKPNIAAEPYPPDVFGDHLPVPIVRPHFDIGDIVWAQARGLPSWPGKIVDENKVGKGKADDGKKWVMWFGDHTFSQVEVDRLKTLNEGLRSLDDKTRKKKYRAKKARISLEQAITEALEELEMREQLKARQGVRSKGKKKRLR